MPLVEALEQERLQLQRIVGGRVGYAHHFGKHQEHEQIIFITPGSSDSATVWCAIGFFEKKSSLAEPMLKAGR